MLYEFSDSEESKAQMFVVVSIYQAKAGEEDSIIAIHEDWQRNHSSKAKIYLSWELLRNIEASREFIAIAYFESEELARAMANDLNHDAWYYRLVSMIENGPECTQYAKEWQAL